jgi:hypothetical protein
MDKKSIIDLSNKIHNFYYDYTKVEDSGKMNKIKIICPIHGEFEQRLDVHLKGSGCIKCGINSRKNNIFELISK